MTESARSTSVEAAEKWFEDNGLPYFVASNQERVAAGLSPTRVVPVAIAIAVVTVGAAIVTGVSEHDVSDGIVLGAVVVGVMVFLYGLLALHLMAIVKWAIGVTFGSLGWVFPLLTRALPLLLLFITFLFINTEVWQVASYLDRALLWLTVMLFAAVAVVFLLVRLPEEVRDIQGQAVGDRLLTGCEGTPLADAARDLGGAVEPGELSRAEKVNMVLVMLIAQAVQVFLLSVLVFSFFICFGKVAITDKVMQAWVGPDAPHDLPYLDWLPISNELFQVSVFLAAFSGLYFTVYAVTDESYRRTFFTPLAAELETAIAVRAVYRHLTPPG